MSHKKLYLITALIYLFIGGFALTALREKEAEYAASKQTIIATNAHESQQDTHEHIKKGTVGQLQDNPAQIPAPPTIQKPEEQSAHAVPAEKVAQTVPAPIVPSDSTPAQTTTPETITVAPVTPDVNADLSVVTTVPVTSTPPMSAPKAVKPLKIVVTPPTSVSAPACGVCGRNLQKNIACPMAEQSVSIMLCAITQDVQN